METLLQKKKTAFPPPFFSPGTVLEFSCFWRQRIDTPGILAGNGHQDFDSVACIQSYSKDMFQEKLSDDETYIVSF
ncbi:1966_t:CDS:2 [Ambispora leptoticha]|uniref:1966_t:CDS:1 n=1 Tax=Ambispora leptoticha TaxID=144679 RepID=A0A9N8VC50_9GLOM|nr:1966_t:CDS:2 [Ambispora leptoticha]